MTGTEDQAEKSSKEITNSELLELLTRKFDERFDSLSKCIEANNKKIVEDLQEVNIVISVLKEENQAQRDRIQILEKKVRKNNLAVFGLPPEGENFLHITLDKINSLLNTQLSAGDISDLYKPRGGAKTPIIIEFVSYTKKREILNRVKEFAQDLKQARVFITHDFSREERKIRKFLREESDRLKKEGKIVKISGNRLWVDGTAYDYECLLAEREDLNSEENLVEGGSGDLEREAGNKRRLSTPSPIQRQITTRLKKRKEEEAREIN